MELITAARNGDIATVRRLLREGHVGVNVTDKYGSSPLHKASYTGILDIVKTLIEAGANVNQTDKLNVKGFSLMGNIKNDWRSRLASNTVTALMTIKLSEEAVDTYDPSNAIMEWSVEHGRFAMWSDVPKVLSAMLSNQLAYANTRSLHAHPAETIQLLYISVSVQKEGQLKVRVPQDGV
ncbi:hypothetical protein EMCRGX_G034748 [Ephydatia muelleri]